MSQLDKVIDSLVEGTEIEQESYNQLLSILEGMSQNLDFWKRRSFEVGLVFKHLSMEKRNRVAKLVQRASADLSNALQILQGQG